MTALLNEGETYTIRVTTTNTSNKAGTPVPAMLTINISALVASQVIMDDSEVYNFGATEIKSFEFAMAVPMGAGGKVGMVTAEVLDPNGLKLADGSLDIEIEAVGIPAFTFSNISVRSKECPVATAFQTPVFSGRVSNPGDVTATHTITLWQHNYSYTYSKWSGPYALDSREITLVPGASSGFGYDGYYYDEERDVYDCEPYLSKRYKYTYWLEDELGNRSKEVIIVVS